MDRTWTTPGTSSSLKANWPGVVQANIDEAAGIRDRRIVTAATTLADTDEVVVFNSTTAISQPLPDASTVTAWRRFQLNNINTGDVTITSTLSGTANRVMPQWGAFTIMSTGSVWVIV